MPKWANGDVDGASAHAAENVRNLVGLAKAGEPIVVNNPTCSMFIKEDYPLLLGTTDAKIVSSAARDLGRVPPRGRSQGRAQDRLPEQSWESGLPRSLPPPRPEDRPADGATAGEGGGRGRAGPLLLGTRRHLVDEVRALRGFVALREELLLRNGSSRGASCASDCPLAAIQIEQATGRPVRHPAELLAEAYGLDPNKRTT